MNTEQTHDLVLNASEGALQIVVVCGDELCVAEEWHLEHKATEILASALAQICAQCGIRAGAFRRIACVHGPGSFTGIRLVLTTAAALRRTGDVLLGAINGLEALAYEALRRVRPSAGSRIHVVTHARRNLVHHQIYSCTDSTSLLATSPITLAAPSDVIRQCRSGEYVCGSALGRNAEFAASLEQGVHMLPEMLLPSAETLARLSRVISYANEDIEPLYVRSCDALDNLERLSSRQGMSPEWAKDRFDQLTTLPPHSSL